MVVQLVAKLGVPTRVRTTDAALLLSSAMETGSSEIMRAFSLQAWKLPTLKRIGHLRGRAACNPEANA
jgi:hypothetical protein